MDRDQILFVHTLHDELAHTIPWVSDIRLRGSCSGGMTMGLTWDTALELGVSNETVGVEANFIPVDPDKQHRNVLSNATFAGIGAFIG